MSNQIQGSVGGRPAERTVEPAAARGGLPRDPRDLIYLSPGGHGRMHALAGLQSLGWALRRANDARSALRQLQANPDRPHAVLVDLREGFELRDLDELGPALSVRNAGWIAGVASEQLDQEPARRLIRDYCYDYVTLPCPEGVLHTVIGHAHGMAALACGHGLRHPAGSADPTRVDGMIGRSDALRSLCRLLRKAAATDAPVFIAGETGTGKELAAQALHRHSARARGPFVAVHCGAMPPEQVVAELFGAPPLDNAEPRSRPPGRFELAHGGTLFLDDLHALPLDAQAALLQALEAGPGDAPAADVRLVAASHEDLETAMAAGRFRADLYHRLCVLRLHQPPLRERGGDIDLLAEHALQRCAQDGGRGLKGFSPCARQAMHRHTWPGNVRELFNRVRQAAVMAEGRYLSAADLQLDEAGDSAPVTLEQARDAATREAIERALNRNRRRLGEAARELDVSRVTLYRLMQRLGMRAAEDAAGDSAEAG